MSDENKITDSQYDLVHIAAELLKERDRSFPDEYVQANLSSCVWKILLVLYRLNPRDEGMELSRLDHETSLSQGVILRYVKLLVDDGFVYAKNYGLCNNQDFVFPTPKAIDLIDGIFQRLKTRINAAG